MNPEMTDPTVITYFTGLMSTHTITLVALVEIIVGIAFLSNSYVALACLLLMPVSINAVLFHASIDQANIVDALILLGFNVYLMIVHKDAYKGILKIR